MYILKSFKIVWSYLSTFKKTASVVILHCVSYLFTKIFDHVIKSSICFERFRERRLDPIGLLEFTGCMKIQKKD